MSRLGIDMQTVFGLPPVEHVELAAHLGCSHISTGLAPVPWQFKRFPAWSLHDPKTRRDMKAAMRDLDVTLSVVEGFAVRPQGDAQDRAADLDLAAELGAERASTVCMEPDKARGLDQLAILAELTAQRGMRLTLEFAPPHAINTLEGAVSAIQTIGSPNIRLCIDAMHFFRSGATIARLASLDPKLIGYAQLCDAPKIGDGGEYYQEACFNRKCPGEGELPLGDLLRALPDDLPIGIEAPMLAEVEAEGGVRKTTARLVAASRHLSAQSQI